MDRAERLSRWGFALAVGVPLCSYLSTSGSASYWLDAGELNATAVSLGVPHPPGHPLTPLFGKLVSLVPIGNLALRLAFGQALCASLAAGFLFLAVRRSLLSSDASTDRSASAVGLAVAWLAALCHGYWLQAVRTEVYALQVVLLCVAVERCGAALDGRVRGFGAPLSTAALALGLGLANNHLMAVVALPALLPVVWVAARRAGVRVLVAPLGAGLVGMCAYAYLPIRSATRPFIDLGAPRTLENFAWVISARVYSREMGQGGSEPLADRFADTLVLMHENLHAAFVPLALAGCYLWLRAPATRAVAASVALWGAGAFLARPFVGPVRANPDVLGYLVPAFAACAWLAGAFVHRILGVLGARLPTRLRPAALWAALPLLVLLRWPGAHALADFSGFSATDLFDDQRFAHLPPRALVISSLPQSVFRTWELQALAHARPDTQVLALPFLRYPGFAETVARDAPELVPLVASYLSSGALDLAELAKLAERRALFVELDTTLSRALAPHLLPGNILHRWDVHSAEATRLALAITGRRIGLSTLKRRLGADLADQETARQLLGTHYVDAVYYVVRGRRDAALDSLASARTLFPDDATLRSFAAALEQAGTSGAFDLQPYLFALP